MLLRSILRVGITHTHTHYAQLLLCCRCIKKGDGTRLEPVCEEFTATIVVKSLCITSLMLLELSNIRKSRSRHAWTTVSHPSGITTQLSQEYIAIIRRSFPLIQQDKLRSKAASVCPTGPMKVAFLIVLIKSLHIKVFADVKFCVALIHLDNVFYRSLISCWEEHV